MASLTQILMRRRRMRIRKAGRTRKTQLSRKSTLGYDELFAGFGDPGQPVPAAQNDK